MDKVNKGNKTSKGESSKPPSAGRLVDDDNEVPEIRPSSKSFDLQKEKIVLPLKKLAIPAPALESKEEVVTRETMLADEKEGKTCKKGKKFDKQKGGNQPSSSKQ